MGVLKLCLWLYRLECRESGCIKPTGPWQEFGRRLADRIQALPPKLYIAVCSVVHPATGALAKYAAHDANQDVIFDDTVEFWIDNSPGSDGGQLY